MPFVLQSEYSGSLKKDVAIGRTFLFPPGELKKVKESIEEWDLMVAVFFHHYRIGLPVKIVVMMGNGER